MNTPFNRGARLQALTRQPSVDLAKLIEVLIPVLNPNAANPQSDHPKDRPFIYFDSDRKRLKICTSGVLRRLFSSPDFKEAFKVDNTGSDRGFVLDFDAPKIGYSAKLGGRLAEGNDVLLPKLLDRLLSAIDAACPSEDVLSGLLLPDSEKQLRQLAKQIKVPFDDTQQRSSLQAIEFNAQSLQGKGQGKSVAKLISALEQVDARDYFQKMTTAIADYMEQQDQDEEEIQEVKENLQTERERADSQIGRFLNFLENEALARVRANICLSIMEEIAAIARQQLQSNRNHGLLVRYVETIVGIINLSQRESLSVDLSLYFGNNAQFTLNDYLNQALFYSCLAVWPEAKAQIFEEKTTVETGEAIQREVSYRFRVNGNNPETKKTAFESRLERIKERLENFLDQENSSGYTPYQINKALAELIFLDSVTPSFADPESEPSFNPDEWLVSFKERMAWLRQTDKQDIKPKIQAFLADLQQRKTHVNCIADALISILKEKEERLLNQVKNRSSRQFICVKRNIVNWERLQASHTSDLLRGNGGKEQAEWFKHLEISDQPEPGSLFTVEVKTQLSGYNLVFQDSLPLEIQGQRVFSPHLLQVLWVPYEYKPKLDEKKELILNAQGKPIHQYQPSDIAIQARPWALGAAIEIEYETRILQVNPERKGDPTAAQYHTAAIAAFEVIIYVCLWRTIQRLRNLQPNFTALVLRLQTQAQERENIASGESYVYAAAQSIEMVLNQDIPLRMQGFVLNNLQKTTGSYVKQGSFRALLSAFPLRLSTPTPPHLAKLGMITYSTRPCDEQPEREQSINYNLLSSKSYTATAIQEPFNGYEIKAEHTDLDILPVGDRVGQQRLIKEEIRQLQSQGCEHIILLSHSYGGRKLNRTAPHSNYLLQRDFLEDIYQSFPDLTLYPLVKDEFPATRLYKRVKESGFEINRAEYHGNFLSSSERETVRDLIPVYTFATLTFVGSNGDQRPQSGFCAYFLLSDHQVSNLAWTERARQHLLNADGRSPIHPCLIHLLRGIHFLEAEKIAKDGLLLPVLNPYHWISPTTKEGAGEVQILGSRRKGKVWLSYPALLSHLSTVLHRQI